MDLITLAASITEQIKDLKPFRKVSVTRRHQFAFNLALIALCFRFVSARIHGY